jgi:16S rRNA (adenine1518-N6/adenine1519-N6)-dimethyltransferase
MQPLPPLNVPALLRQYALRPDRGLGQNFLVDESALHKIIAVAEVTGDEDVLEIGPGLGSLTRHLALAARSVVAVELDARLLPPLKEVLSGFANVSLVQGDILSLNPARLVNRPDTLDERPEYLVVANIPYYITSAVLRHLLEAERRPRRLVLTVQEEVAARICSLPGDMSLLSLSVQVYGKPSVKARIPAGAFYPAPKVDSAVIRIDLFPGPCIPSPSLNTFFRLAKAGFSQKRKTLRNSLAGGMGWSTAETAGILQRAGILPQRRAESLSLDEWRQLVEVVLGADQGAAPLPSP